MTRMNHFVRSRNLPYSIEEITSVVNQCITCCELKPRFYKPPSTHLVKATQPFKRLNIDFKGPLLTSNKNRYILTIIDEYSRFPLVFPCPDTSSSSVLKCFKNLFSLFDIPAYIHFDRSSSLISEKLCTFLHTRGVATSRRTKQTPDPIDQEKLLKGTIVSYFKHQKVMLDFLNCRLVLNTTNILK